MYCPKCGKQNPETESTCSYCGYQLTTETKQAKVTPFPAEKSKKGVALVAIVIALLILVTSVLGIYFVNKSNEKEPTSTTNIQETTTQNDTPNYNNFKLIEDGVLTVAISGNFHPFAYIENEKVVGFDADIVTAIANKLDLEVKFVIVEYAKLIQTVSAGNADIAINALALTDAQSTSVDLTSTYVSVETLSDGVFKTEEYVIAVRKSNGLLITVNNIINDFKKDGTIASLKAKYNIFEGYYSSYEDFENQPTIENLNLPESGDYIGKSIHINAIGVLRFNAGKTRQSAFLTNPKENENICFLKYTFYIDSNKNDIIDEDDELLYASDLICPGYAVKEFTINRGLTQGEYKVIILEQAYSYDKALSLLYSQTIQTQIIVE